jgi:hypothetical protein
VIGFGVTWLEPLLSSSCAKYDGCNQNENHRDVARPAGIDLAAQMAALMGAIEQKRGRILTPDEADALATLTDALWALIGQEEGDHDGDIQP